MHKRTRLPREPQGWPQVQPDALYLALARLIAQAKAFLQRTHTGFSPVDRAQPCAARVRRPKRGR